MSQMNRTGPYPLERSGRLPHRREAILRARIVQVAKHAAGFLILLGMLAGLVGAGVVVFREARDFWREVQQTPASQGPSGCGGIDDLTRAGNCEQETTDPAEGYDYDPSRGATGTPGDLYRDPADLRP